MQLETISHKVQFCVIGGGLAGMCAAIAAARHGIKTLIMQERPMFGGNASSEVRMWICGADNCLETGIIEELRLENLYRNPNSNYSVWDSILFEKVRFQDNLISLLNTSCLSAETEDDRITSVTGYQQTTQCYHKVEADYFADCSGDSILALLAGADFRIGREDKSEFGETLAQNVSDKKTMGLSCILQAREYATKQHFTPPEWANKYPDDDSFPARCHVLNNSQNFWWLELGGNQNSIADTETLRDELLKDAYGIWDHIKNHGDHGADNWALDWVGILPGKRESRRCIGDYILNEKDVLSGGKFDDTVAYGGWPIDDHNPDGFRHYGRANLIIKPEQPYGIPLRSLYSRNISNLLFAGRNISATHTALSSTRVMATCALIGQAMGTAASICINENVTPHGVYETKIKTLQNKLRDAGCYIPGTVREIPELTKSAKINLPESELTLLQNGIERPDENMTVNYATLNIGDSLEFDFGETKELSELRLVFDPDFSRKSITSNKKMRVFAQKLMTGKDFEPVKVANTLVKSFRVLADGKEIFADTNNRNSLRKIALGVKAQKLTVIFDETRGIDKVHLFSADVK